MLDFAPQFLLIEFDIARFFLRELGFYLFQIITNLRNDWWNIICKSVASLLCKLGKSFCQILQKRKLILIAHVAFNHRIGRVSLTLFREVTKKENYWKWWWKGFIIYRQPIWTNVRMFEEPERAKPLVGILFCLIFLGKTIWPQSITGGSIGFQRHHFSILMFE